MIIRKKAIIHALFLMAHAFDHFSLESAEGLQLGAQHWVQGGAWEWWEPLARCLLLWGSQQVRKTVKTHMITTG